MPVTDSGKRRPAVNSEEHSQRGLGKNRLRSNIHTDNAFYYDKNDERNLLSTRIGSWEKTEE